MWSGQWNSRICVYAVMPLEDLSCWYQAQCSYGCSCIIDAGHFLNMLIDVSIPSICSRVPFSLTYDKVSISVSDIFNVNILCLIDMATYGEAGCRGIKWRYTSSFPQSSLFWSTPTHQLGLIPLILGVTYHFFFFFLQSFTLVFKSFSVKMSKRMHEKEIMSISKICN